MAKLKIFDQIEELSPTDLAEALTNSGYPEYYEVITNKDINGKSFLNLNEFELSKYRKFITRPQIERLLNFLTEIKDNPSLLLSDKMDNINKTTRRNFDAAKDLLQQHFSSQDAKAEKPKLMPKPSMVPTTKYPNYVNVPTKPEVNRKPSFNQDKTINNLIANQSNKINKPRPPKPPRNSTLPQHNGAPKNALPLPKIPSVNTEDDSDDMPEYDVPTEPQPINPTYNNQKPSNLAFNNPNPAYNNPKPINPSYIPKPANPEQKPLYNIEKPSHHEYEEGPEVYDVPTEFRPYIVPVPPKSPASAEKRNQNITHNISLTLPLKPKIQAPAQIKKAISDENIYEEEPEIKFDNHRYPPLPSRVPSDENVYELEPAPPSEILKKILDRRPPPVPDRPTTQDEDDGYLVAIDILPERPLPPIPSNLEFHLQKLGRPESERYLSNLPIGSFLLRESQNYYGVLMVKTPVKILNVPLIKNSNQFYLLTENDDLEVVKFDNIDELVDYYRNNHIEFDEGRILLNHI